MVDPLIATRKVAALRDRVARTRGLLPPQGHLFATDRDRQELVAFNFMLACQEMLDLAAHALSDAGLDLPTTAGAHLAALAARGELSHGLAMDLGACLGARNLIAHTYAEVDPIHLHRELPGGLDALDRFAAVAVGGLDDAD